MKHNYLLKSFFIILLFLLSNLSQAAYFRNIQLKVIQPDGTQINVFATGDEFYNWIHDANNYTIVKNHTTGYYVYAALQGIDLIPTSFIAGASDPAAAGLVPGINIPSWKMELIRKDFLDATPKKPSVVPPLGPLAPDVAGSVNNIVVFIRFSDQDDFTEPITTYDNMFNDNVSEANSMYNYFKDVSYNNVFVTSSFYPLPEGTVIVSYQDSHPRDYYAPYDEVSNPTGYQDSERTEREHTLLKNAVDAITADVPAGLDVDFDNDGNVDNVCFIVKGTTTAWSTLLWPHRWSLFSQTAYINGKQVWDYNLQLETFLSGSGVGVLAHEMTHTFGCPDLYHYSDNGISPVGPWDLMDGNTNPPQHIGAYMKKKYTGWISSIPEITTPGTYTLNPLANASNNAYKLISPNSPTEFFIFEYREKTGTFEGALPNSGLLIYRINTLAGDGNAGGPPDEIYLYRPGGTDTTNGSVYDGYFSLASGRTSFGDFTNPNDWLSDGMTMGGINISSVTAADATISFTVNMNTMAEFTASSTTTCINQTIVFTDQSFASPTSWSWSISPNTIVYVNGTSATSQNPQIQFTATGDYSITLTASGPNGTSTLTKTDYIHILPSFSLPLSENFESGSFSTNNWTINNPDGVTTWSFFNNAGGNGSSTKSVTMNFYNYNAISAVDDLIAKPLVLPATGNAKLTFKVAYCQYDDTYHDSLKVYISTDCGTTYSYLIYSKGDGDLATGAPTQTFFVPTIANDWRKDSIDLSGFLGQTITIKFTAINGYGNNLYLDDINVTGVSPVTANFTGTPTTLCQGGTVQFTDQSTGSPTSWQWNFGDNTFSTLQNPSHVYNTSGLFSVTLTVTKPGSSHTLNKTNYITVNLSQTVTASITQVPPGPVCANSSVTFNANVINGGTNPGYQWKKNGVNVGSNTNTYTSSSLINGDNISCQVTSNVSCPANNPALSNTIQVNVLQNVTPAVTVSAQPSGAICAGSNVVFTATGTNGGNSPVYQWKVNNINVGTNSTTYSSSTLLQGDVVTCQLTSSAQCVTVNPVTSTGITMSVTTPLELGVSISANPSTTFCQGTTVTFSALVTNGGDSPLYVWKVNGIPVGYNPAYSSEILNNGDIITCQVSSSASCVTGSPATSNSLTVTVLQSYPVSVSIDASPSVSACEGNPVTFLATPVNEGSSPIYQWFVNGILSGNGSSLTSSSFPDNASVYCILTSSLSTCTIGNPAQSNILYTEIHPLPVVDLGNDTTISISSILSLDAGSGYIEYTWNTGALSQTIDISTTGEYSVTVTDQYGCSGSDFIQVSVGFFELQGYVKYNNNAATPLNNATVTLKQGNTVITSAQTDSQGYYLFDGLQPGTYKIVPSTTKPWGGVNSTDALLIMKHFVGMSYLTGLPLKAANVDNFPAVNSLDAFNVQRRTVGLITSFPAGDWAFETPNITITGEIPVSQNIKALTIGDVNSSYTPPLVKNETRIDISDNGSLYYTEDSQLDLPVYISSTKEIGAITLFLKYQQKDWLLRGITCNGIDNNNLLFSDDKGNLAISWADLQSLSINPSEPLFTFHFQAAGKNAEGYVFSNLTTGEFADPFGIPYDDILLQQPRVASWENNASSVIHVFPNPVKDKTTIRFTLAENSDVDLSVYNSHGQQINILRKQYYLKGTHELNWNIKEDNGYRLHSGVYYVRLVTAENTMVVPVIIMP